jgi:4-amino-4-deoxy-L-arabinose transferase-like glycosyltransferase
LYFWFAHTAHGGDFAATSNGGDGYYDISQNLIMGNGFSTEHEPPYVPTSYRTPGLPYFIALIHSLFGSYYAVIAAYLLIGSIVPLLGMRIAQYITEKRSIIIVVGLLLALEPTSILFSTVLLSETLFTFLFLLSVLCLFQYWKERSLKSLVVSSVLLGVSILTRPTIEYLPIVLVGIILWEARKQFSRMVCIHASLYMAIVLITLSPWIYRNYHEFGVLGLSSQQGAALYVIAVPSVLAIENNTSFSKELNRNIAGPNETNFAQSDAYSKLAIPILLNHPRSLALMSMNTMFSFFTYDGTYDVLHHIKLYDGMYDVLAKAKLDSGIRVGEPTLLVLKSSPLAVLKYLVAVSTTPLALILIGRIVWLLITLLFMIGVWQYMRKERRNVFTVTMISIVAYLMITTIVVGYTVNYRYRMPINSIIFTFAAYEAVILISLCRRKYQEYRLR